ncbi:hypothetical protein VTI28DRAFT_4477 [Corynascus sepedonium]
MARLTWWKKDEARKVYQNVISKRQIPASEWKDEYKAFVQVEDKDGNSFTSDFLPQIPPVPSRSESASLEAMNLGSTPGGGRATQPHAVADKTSSAKAAPTSAVAPLKPKPATTAPPKPKPATATAPPKSSAGTADPSKPKPTAAASGASKAPSAGAAAFKLTTSSKKTHKTT